MITRTLPALLATASALTPVSALAGALPQGGAVAGGQVAIDTPDANHMTITQSSDRAIVNWQSFSVGEGSTVKVVQPDVSSALLNRVTGDATSVIAGHLQANGQVFLVNPNGIMITGTGSVNAAGFTASTLDIADEDFMAGGNRLTVSAPRDGQALRFARGGFAGLLGGAAGDGLVLASLVEDSEGRAALDLGGDGFLQVGVPQGGISVAGTIDARTIALTTGTATDLARGVVQVSGALNASSVSQEGGTIRLTGAEVQLTGAQIDASGVTGGGSIAIGGGYQGTGDLAHARSLSVDGATVIRADALAQGDGGEVVLWSDRKTDFAGTITARGGAAGGDGGSAEVSGKVLLAYTGSSDLRAPKGKTGDLLLDPYNVTISNDPDSNQSGFTASGDDSVINVTTLQNALAMADVTVSTGSGGSQEGNITVADALTWSDNVLTLDAVTDIDVNAAMTMTNGGLTLSSQAITVTAPITVKGAGHVNANVTSTSHITFVRGGYSFKGSFTYLAEDGSALTGPSPGSYTTNGKSYTIITSLGAEGSTTGADLQGMNGDLGNYYLLAADIDASATASWNGGAGFLPIGNSTNKFTGAFQGAGHTISGLTIYRPAADNIGFFGNIEFVGEYYSASNFNLHNISITGRDNVGGAFGNSDIAGSDNVGVSGHVSGRDKVGGLAGRSDGYVNSTVSIANVSGNNRVGGIVGDSGSNPFYNIYHNYFAGSVSGNDYVGGVLGGSDGPAKLQNNFSAGSVSGNDYVGGILGKKDGGSSYVSINSNIFTGSVSGNSNVGVLFGDSAIAGSINANYWDTDTTGFLTGVGGTGLTTAQLQSGTLPAGLAGSPFFWRGVSGLYPYNRLMFPDGVHAVSGTLKDNLGNLVSGKAVYAGSRAGLLIPGLTGANGYYYALGDPDISSSGGDLFAFANIDASRSAAATFGYAGETNRTLNLVEGAFLHYTDQTLLSRVPTRSFLLTYFAGNAAAVNAIENTGPERFFASSEFDIDEAVDVDHPMRFSATNLYVSDAVTVRDGQNLGLVAGGSIAITAPITVLGAGDVAMAYDSTSLDNLSFGLTANGFRGSLTYLDASGNPLTGASPGSFSLNDNVHTIITSLGAEGSTTGTDLQGMQGNLAGSYLLGADIDASATAGWNSNAGFAPVGTDSNPFTGTFLGGGHRISELAIERPSLNGVGLFGYVSGGLVSNVGVVGGSVSGSGQVGSLIGFLTDADGLPVVSQSYATGTVNGVGGVGGLIGRVDDNGTVSKSFATGTVSGDSSAGGLAGSIGQDSLVMDSFATGRVKVIGSSAGGLIGSVSLGTVSNAFATGAVSSNTRAGGLIGGFGGGTVNDSYATGAVSSLSDVGGLIGLLGAGTSVNNSYWDSETTGQTTSAGGSTALTTAQFQSGSLPSGFDGSTWATGSGLYPYLSFFFPDGVQAVSGTVTNADGTTAALASVGLSLNGVNPSLYGSVQAGANGYFYAPVSPESYADGTAKLAATLTADGASTIGGLAYGDGLSLDSDGNFAVGTLKLGRAHHNTALGSTSALLTEVDNTFGASVVSAANTALAAMPFVIAARQDFAIDSVLSRTGSVAVATTGNLSIANGASLSSSASGDAILLAAGGSFTNNGDASALSSATGGRWLVYQGTGLGGTRGGLVGTSYYGTALDLSTLAFAATPPSGNRFVYAEQPTLTISVGGSSAYDGSVKSATLASSGLINGDTLQLGGTATGITTSSANAGDYSLTPAGLTSALNYKITYAQGTYKITPRATVVTYTADALSRIYGDTPGTMTGTASASNLASGDTLASITSGSASWTTSAGSTSDIGSYAIEGTGL
ncbi:filamentous hemagglutinin N-terminal domain-containing protein, partial [Aurantiacibacter flavus]